MGNALGHFSFAQIGDESSYGGGGTCTQRVEVVSCGLEVVNALRPDHDTYLTAGLHRVNAFHTLAGRRDRLDALEPLDVGLQ